MNYNTDMRPIDFSLLDNMRYARVRRWLPWVAVIGSLIPFGLVELTANDAWILLWWLLLAIGLVGWWASARAHDENAFKAFAFANGFEFQPSVNDFGSGTLFSLGHSKRGRLGMKGALDGWQVDFFQYLYETGGGKSRSTYDATVMRVRLPRVLPHMVIDSVIEAGNGGPSTLPIKFDKAQKIELEGDFQKYFDLYAPDTYGVSALTVLAPDAMEALLRYAALCDIEIIDNNLYFYWPDRLYTRQGVENKFQTVQAVLKEIGDTLARGDIYAQTAQAALHAPTATRGVRLAEDSKIIWIGVVLFVGFMFLFSTNPPQRLGIIIQLVLQVGWPLAILAIALVRRRHRRRLQQQLTERYPRLKG